MTISLKMNKSHEDDNRDNENNLASIFGFKMKKRSKEKYRI